MVKTRKSKSAAALKILKEVNMESQYENIMKLSSMNFSIFLRGLQLEQDVTKQIKEARRIARNTTYAAREYQSRQKNKVKDLNNRIREAKKEYKVRCDKLENLTVVEKELEREIKTLAILTSLYDGQIRCQTCGMDYTPSCLTLHYIAIEE